MSERKSKATSSEIIIEKYADIIYSPESVDIAEIKELRFFLERLFNPDSTVYPSYPNSVLNISSKWFVRPYVPAEAGIGRFLFDILSTPIEGKRSIAIDIIKQALMNDDDDLSRTVKPIIVRRPENERIARSEPEYGDIALDATKMVIRSGFDRIARNCIAYSEKHGTNSLLRNHRTNAEQQAIVANNKQKSVENSFLFRCAV